MFGLATAVVSRRRYHSQYINTILQAVRVNNKTAHTSGTTIITIIIIKPGGYSIKGHNTGGGGGDGSGFIDRQQKGKTIGRVLKSRDVGAIRIFFSFSFFFLPLLLCLRRFFS